jgi:fructokinase
VVNGQMLHGLMHSEIGHIPVPRHPDDSFAGNCPYHKNCLEGMASGPAIRVRWGEAPPKLPLDHRAWEFEAYYLAQAASTLLCVLSPQRIIFGGGVMHQDHLFPMIRQKTVQLLNGYIQEPAVLEHIDSLIVPPGLGDRAGAVGALELAQRTLR